MEQSSKLNLPRLGSIAFWLIAFAAIASRKIDRVLTAQFYAEDGTRFFSEAESLGWGSVFVPINSHLNVVARILACLIRPIDWEHIPFAYSITAGALMAAVALRILVAQIPKPAAIIGALAVIIVPTAGEVFLNLCCLHFLTAIVLVVNLLEPAPTRTSECVRRTIEVGLSALSGPEVIMLAPLAIWRFWQWRGNRFGLYTIAGLGLASGIQVASVLSQPRASFEHVIPNWIFFPFYSKALFTHWYWANTDHSGYVLAIAIAVSMFALFLTNCRRAPAAYLLVSAALYLMAARSVSPVWPNPFGDGDRYAFVPFVFVTWAIGWLWAGAAVNGQRVIAGILLCAVVASGIASWQRAPAPDHHWAEQVREAKNGQRTTFIIPGPETWSFAVPSSHTSRHP